MRRTRVVVGACSAVGVVERLFFLPNAEKKDMVGGLAAGTATHHCLLQSGAATGNRTGFNHSTDALCPQPSPPPAQASF